MAVLTRLIARRRERPFFTAVAGLFLLFLLAYPFVDWWLRSIGVASEFGYWDFGAYRGAVDRWLDDGPLYIADNGSYHGSYLYPPVVLLVFAPFVFLPGYELSVVAWNVASVALLWGGLQLAVRELGVRLSLLDRAVLLWALLGFQPLLLSMKMGQTAAFMAGLLSLALAAMLRTERAGQWLSGALTGLVGVVKIAYATVGAHLLVDRDRFAGALVAGLALAGISVLVFGLDANRTYVDVLAWGFNYGGSTRPPADGLWLPPYFKPLYWLPGSLALRIVAGLLIAVGALLATRDAHRQVFALGVVAFPLLSPRTYAYYFVAVLPAIVVMLDVEFERDGRPALPLVGLWLLAIHSHGLWFIMTYAPGFYEALMGVVPWIDVSFATVSPLLQPGLWGCLILIVLAADRVIEHVERPRWPAASPVDR